VPVCVGSEVDLTALACVRILVESQGRRSRGARNPKVSIAPVPVREGSASLASRSTGCL